MSWYRCSFGDSPTKLRRSMKPKSTVRVEIVLSFSCAQHHRLADKHSLVASTTSQPAHCVPSPKLLHSVVFHCFALYCVAFPGTDPLFGFGANIALIFSGQYVKVISKMRSSLGPGVDPWGVSLRYLMGAVVGSGGVLLATYTWMLRNVVDKGTDGAKAAAKPKKKKRARMGLKESAKYLMSSPYIRNLAVLVISYGMCINLVEVSWKSKIKVWRRKGVCRGKEERRLQGWEEGRKKKRIGPYCDLHSRHTMSVWRGIVLLPFLFLLFGARLTRSGIFVSISVSSPAASLPEPERLLGLHG